MPDGLPNVVVAVPERKAWWKSKTLWFNAFVAACGAAELAFSVFQPHLPVNVYAAISFALVVGNAALRVLSSQGLKL